MCIVNVEIITVTKRYIRSMVDAFYVVHCDEGDDITSLDTECLSIMMLSLMLFAINLRFSSHSFISASTVTGLEVVSGMSWCLRQSGWRRRLSQNYPTSLSSICGAAHAQKLHGESAAHMSEHDGAQNRIHRDGFLWEPPPTLATGSNVTKLIHPTPFPLEKSKITTWSHRS